MKNKSQLFMNVYICASRIKHKIQQNAYFMIFQNKASLLSGQFTLKYLCKKTILSSSNINDKSHKYYI